MKNLSRVITEVAAKEQWKALQWFIEFANLELDNLEKGDKAKLSVEVKERLRDFKLPRECSKEYWEYMRELQKVIQKFFADSVKEPSVQSLLIRQIHSSYEPALYRENGKFQIRMIKNIPIGELFRSEHFMPEEGKRHLDVRLSELLNGLSDSAVQKCPECHKYFLSSLSKKKFCNSKCAWRFNSRKWRRNNKEEYNEKQKKVMKKRYREKVLLPNRV